MSYGNYLKKDYSGVLLTVGSFKELQGVFRRFFGSHYVGGKQPPFLLTVQTSSMDSIPTYEDFKDFKENYFADFTNQNELNYYNYLKCLSDKYIDVHSVEISYFNDLLDSAIHEEIAILNKLEPLIPSDAHLLLFHDLWGDYCNENEDVIFENPNIFCDIIEFEWTDEARELIREFFALMKYQKTFRNRQLKITKKYIKIVSFIEDEKKKIEETIKGNTNIKTTIDFPTIEIPENDFSENEDKEKIIILEKLGIIDYVLSIQTKPDIKTHTAEILSSFTGINSKSIYSYIRPMLNSIRDDEDKNSPYKNPENLLSANKTIQKLKVKTPNANS